MIIAHVTLCSSSLQFAHSGVCGYKPSATAATSCPPHTSPSLQFSSAAELLDCYLLAPAVVHSFILFPAPAWFCRIAASHANIEGQVNKNQLEKLEAAKAA